MATPLLRIGTRGSRLALAQAAELCARLQRAHPELAAAGAVETVVIRTTGDQITDRPLLEIGGKGLFTKEIEEALIDGRIDLAVHSMKDMPTVLPDGLAIAGHLPREDARDVLIAPKAGTLRDLPPGASVGTSSLRRQAQLLHARPDLKIVPLRGNVETRIRKIEGGEADATVLALAGLKRLGRDADPIAILSLEDMLPAPAQGVIAVEIRADDSRARSLLAAIDHRPTALCATAERALLAALDGSCRTPIAAFASVQDNRIALDALVISPDGRVCHRLNAATTTSRARELGRETGDKLRALAGPQFFDFAKSPA
jgi:hydroxymethylbilane synthase